LFLSKAGLELKEEKKIKKIYFSHIYKVLKLVKLEEQNKKENEHMSNI